MKSSLLVIFQILSFIPIVLSQNIAQLSKVEYDVKLSDVWGYTSPNGQEYALVGLINGTSIVNIERPTAPIEISRITGGVSEWKDIKTYQNRAFVVGEYPQGLQIIDLSSLPDTIPASDYFYWGETIPGVGRIGACHNIFIEEQTGIAYLSGCQAVGVGVIMLDVKPDIPTYLGIANSQYSHDAYVRNDTLYSSDIFDGVFTIIDVKDKSNPIILTNHRTPAQATHNTWLSDDGKTLFTTDEINDAPLSSYDISDLENIRLLDRFFPEGSRGTGLIPHNVHVKNDFLVTSYYAEGVVITDATRPHNLIQVGQFDTFNGSNDAFLGAWGAFPFFDSDIVLVSDVDNGLFILQPDYLRASFLDGMVKDSVTEEALVGVTIQVIFRGSILTETRTNGSGIFELGTVESGPMEVIISKENYQEERIEVNLSNGTAINLDISLLPNFVAITGDTLVGCAPHQVRFNSGGLPITEFLWEFEGGNPATSTDANPLVTYSTEGTYSVKLNSNFDGEEVLANSPNLIRVTDRPTTNFSFERDRRTFTFTNLTENIDSLIWDFGDGNTSTEKNPIHQFMAGQLPVVTLTTINECGSNSFSIDLNDNTTSLESLQLLTTFKAVPNPFSQQSTIEYEFSPKLDNVRFQLRDIAGVLLGEIPLSTYAGTFVLKKRNLPKGVYFGQILSAEAGSQVIKLVVL